MMTNKFRQIILFSAMLASMIVIPYGYARTVDLDRANILFLSSWHKDMPWQKEVGNGFEKGLKKEGVTPNLFYEYLDSGRFKYQNQIDIFKSYLSKKFAGNQGGGEAYV